MLKYVQNIKNRKPNLVKLLHAVMDEYEDKRLSPFLHASDMTKSGNDVFCPREPALLDEDIKYPSKYGKTYLDTASRVTYAEGNDKQDRLTNEWLRDSVVGAWRCTSCGDLKEWGKYPYKSGCNRQQHNCNWRYMEKRFIDPVSGISGGIDFMLDLGLGKFVVVENKIMTTDQFIKLTMPLAEHRLRTQLYLQLIANSNDSVKQYINTDWAYVLYCMRGHGKKSEQAGNIVSPFKSYIVEAKQDSVQGYLNRAYAYNFSRKDSEGRLPCGVCISKESKRAKKCPVVDKCFSGEYPGVITWKDNKGDPMHSDCEVTLGKEEYEKEVQDKEKFPF